MSPSARPVPGEQLPVAPPAPTAAPTAAPGASAPGTPAHGTQAEPASSGLDRSFAPAKAWDTLRRQRPLSLRSRLVGMLLILLIAGFAVIGGVTHASMAARLNAQLTEDLSNAAQRVIGQIKRQFSPNAPSDPTGQQQLGTLSALYLQGNTSFAPSYTDPKNPGRDSIALGASDTEQIERLASGATSSLTVDRRLEIGDYRVLVQPVTLTFGNGSVVQGVLVVGLPLDEVRRTLGTLDLSMMLVSLGGIVLIGTLGTVLISRALRPLARVSAVASAVAEQPLEKGEVDVAVRVAPEDAIPGTEVGNVGAALNSLLDNVDGALEVRARSEARMRRFAADASHELRTPLAAIQGYSELIGATEALSDDGDRSLGRVREQTRRMTELVENLLLLARLDEGRTPASEPVDLTRLAVDLSRDFTVAAKDHRWKLEFDAEHPVLVTGDEPQLNRVLQNLMSNARKHTSDGTTVTVGVGTTADGQALLTVTDNGEGIDPEFLDKVFDRFARADAARSGSLPTTGLGLSIVKAIVDSHGGRISVESEPGRTRFSVRLPLAP
ncbi:sensor histidine kinase [Galactobacter valiniphilus]|nr:HAMP domain-containing sensor histidine kinase [Galactobacter valiniphilus]